MVSDPSSRCSISQSSGVLILVLMEYGLGQVVRKYDLGDGGYVLILVLMEYGLGL